MTGGCSEGAGLSPATPTDLTAIEASPNGADASATGAACALRQLTGGTNCSEESSAGWCYIAGSCVATSSCMQDICETAGFIGANVTHTLAWLVCD